MTLADQAKDRYDAIIIIYSWPTIKGNWQEALKEVKNLHNVDYFFISKDDFIQNKQSCKVEDLNNKTIPLF